MKPTKESVAIVIKNGKGGFLAVRRAEGDTFAGQWGLPAATLRGDETNQDTVKRAAKDKLGVDVEILETIGDMTLDKGEYLNHLTEYLVKIVKGEVSLKMRDSSVSQYTEYKYYDDPRILIPAAKNGSICSRIFLQTYNLNWE